MGDILGNINTPWVITRVRSPTINKLGLYESWGSSSFGLTIYPYGSKYLLIESMAGGDLGGIHMAVALRKQNANVSQYTDRDQVGFVHGPSP